MRGETQGAMWHSLQEIHRLSISDLIFFYLLTADTLGRCGHSTVRNVFYGWVKVINIPSIIKHPLKKYTKYSCLLEDLHDEMMISEGSCVISRCWMIYLIVYMHKSQFLQWVGSVSMDNFLNNASAITSPRNMIHCKPYVFYHKTKAIFFWCIHEEDVIFLPY